MWAFVGLDASDGTPTRASHSKQQRLTRITMECLLATQHRVYLHHNPSMIKGDIQCALYAIDIDTA